MNANDTVLMHPTSTTPIFQEACATKTNLPAAIKMVLEHLLLDLQLDATDFVITIKNYKVNGHADQTFWIEVWRSVK
jgi:hypothetical protein